MPWWLHISLMSKEVFVTRIPPSMDRRINRAADLHFDERSEIVRRAADIGLGLIRDNNWECGDHHTFEDRNVRLAVRVESQPATSSNRLGRPALDHARGRVASSVALRSLETWRATLGLNVRFGSLADILRCGSDVRFTPNSGHVRCTSLCPLSAKSGHRAGELQCF